MAADSAPRLLIITQVVDAPDPPLGFFHAWIKEFSKVFPQVSVICLRRGVYDLPGIPVYSLGKEDGTNRLTRAIRFYTYIWRTRRDYDAVFVHMNQEYVLLAGWLWKLMGKRVYLWRNHYAGSLLTDLAALFCTKVFCTSQYSYTAKYRRTVFMPVGVDLTTFAPVNGIERQPRSILFLARMGPAKRPDIFIEALGILLQKGISFIASMYGSPFPGDVPYYESLKARAEQLGLHNRIRFHAGIPNVETPMVYSAHDIFVNCSPSGMYDKTIFEAAACGCVVLTSSEDYAELAGEEYYFDSSPEALAERLEVLLSRPAEKKAQDATHLLHTTETQSLDMLAEQLVRELSHAHIR